MAALSPTGACDARFDTGAVADNSWGMPTSSAASATLDAKR
ncbi:MAG: hypothetical protein ACTHOI_04270 [Sphingomicrobium sp.]